MIVVSRYLPQFLYGHVMINKRYWQTDYELQEMQKYIDKIAADGNPMQHNILQKFGQSIENAQNLL